MDTHPGLGPAQAFRTFWRDRWYRHETEVRWAFLFETLGLEPEYEPTGLKVDCPGVGGYRPDFYLGALNAWVEIKSARPNEGEFAKAKALARATGKAVIVAWGSPSAREACWIYRPTDLRRAGPMKLTSWLPLDGLAFTSYQGAIIVQIDGAVVAHGMPKPVPQADHMRVAVAAAMNLPLMPNDRLLEAG